VIWSDKTDGYRHSLKYYVGLLCLLWADWATRAFLLAVCYNLSKWFYVYYSVALLMVYVVTLPFVTALANCIWYCCHKNKSEDVRNPSNRKVQKVKSLMSRTTSSHVSGTSQEKSLLTLSNNPNSNGNVSTTEVVTSPTNGAEMPEDQNGRPRGKSWMPVADAVGALILNDEEQKRLFVVEQDTSASNNGCCCCCLLLLAKCWVCIVILFMMVGSGFVSILAMHMGGPYRVVAIVEFILRWLESLLLAYVIIMVATGKELGSALAISTCLFVVVPLLGIFLWCNSTRIEDVAEKQIGDDEIVMLQVKKEKIDDAIASLENVGKVAEKLGLDV